MWNTTHTKHNRYENPYASPLSTHDSSVCAECKGPTGLVGDSYFPPSCDNCAETAWSTFSAYPEEDYND
jgi:hypothetical protein